MAVITAAQQRQQHHHTKSPLLSFLIKYRGTFVAVLVLIFLALQVFVLVHLFQRKHDHGNRAPAAAAASTSANANANATMRDTRGQSPVASTATATATARSKNQKKLIFVHIPKTGGSAIEVAGRESGIRWGSHAWGKSRSTALYQSALTFTTKYKITPWHAPPCLLQHNTVTMNLYTSVHNPNHKWYNQEGEDYNDKLDTTHVHSHDPDLFAVVRNPYDRAVSEYRYQKMLKLGVPGTPADMNRYIALHLVKLQGALEQIREKNIDSCNLQQLVQSGALPDYFMEEGHWIPQFDFVFEHKTGRRMIHRVIRYENLHVKFKTLVKDYYPTLNITLTDRRKRINGNNNNSNNNTATTTTKSLYNTRSHHNKPGEEKVCVEQLSAENVRSINKLYANDFRAFGYPLRNPEDHEHQQRLLHINAAITTPSDNGQKNALRDKMQGVMQAKHAQGKLNMAKKTHKKPIQAA